MDYEMDYLDELLYEEPAEEDREEYLLPAYLRDLPSGPQRPAPS